MALLNVLFCVLKKRIPLVNILFYHKNVNDTSLLYLKKGVMHKHN